MTKPDEYQISGQLTITAAQTAVALGDLAIDGPLWIMVETAGPGVRIGNDGQDTVGPHTGFPLWFGDRLTLDYVANLSRVYVYAYAANTVIAWIAKRVGG